MRITKGLKLKSLIITCMVALLVMIFGALLTIGRSEDYERANAQVMPASSVQSDESPLVGETGVVYASGTSGSDTNDGATSSTPVATMQRVLELLPNGGTVNVLSPIIIDSSIDVNPSEQITFMRSSEGLSANYKDGSVSYGEMIKITGSDIVVNFYKTTFDGNNIEPAVGDIKYLILLSSSENVSISFNEGCLIQNNCTRGINILSGNNEINTTDLIITNCSTDYGLFCYLNNEENSESATISFDLSGMVVNNCELTTENNENFESVGGIVSLLHIDMQDRLLSVSNSKFHSINIDLVNGAESRESYSLFFGAENLILTNCKFYDLTTNASNIIFNGSNDVNLETCEFREINMSFALGSLTSNAASLNINNCSFDLLSASSSEYVGFLTNGSDLNVINSSFSRITGMLFYCFNNYNSAPSGTITFDNVDFSVSYIAAVYFDGAAECFNFKNCRVTNVNDNSTYAAIINFTENGEDFPEVIFENNQFLNVSSNIGVIRTRKPISSFTMTNCRFENCIVWNNGGCIYAESNGNWTFNDCVFLNNKATKSGGAIYADDISTSKSFNFTFNNCEFGYNVAGAKGGAICIGDVDNETKHVPGGFEIVDCIFYDNISETYGGAIYTTEKENAIDNCTFQRNIAKNNDGGAICIPYQATPYTAVYNSLFEGNSAGYNGGAIWTDNIDIEYTNFLSNLAYVEGAAVFSRAFLNMSNCLIENNICFFTSSNVRSSIVRALYNHEFDNIKFINNASNIILHLNQQANVTNCVFERNEPRVDSDASCLIVSAPYTATSTHIFKNVIIKNNGLKIPYGYIFYGSVDYSYNTCNGSFNFEEIEVTGNKTSLGLIMVNGPTNITDCNFSGNEIGGTHGLIWNELKYDDSIGEVNITNTIFSGNVTSGKGIYETTGIQDCSVVLTNSAVYGNTDSAGAVVQVGENVDLVVINSKFFSNQGAKGGAISVGNNATLDVSGGIEFGNNYADYGSCVYVERGGKVNLTNLNLHNMSSNGGLLYTEQGGELNVINGTVYDNVATNGSVFYYDGAGVISGVTAYNNSALNGGVLYVGSTGSVILEDVNFYSNSATQSDGAGGNGGAVYTAGIVTLRSGNIGTSGGGNSATNGGGVYVADGGSFTMSYNRKYNLIEERVISSEIFGSVSYNTATYGGGVYIASGGSATINGEHKNAKQEDENSTINGATINNNTVTYHGAGVYVEYDATLTLLGGEIEQNILDGTDNSFEHKGTAIYNGGIVIIDGGKIANNKGVTPSSSGTWFIIGGIYCDSDSILEVNNAIFIGNSCHLGSCIYSHENSNVNVKATKFLSNSIGGAGSADGSICCVRGGNLKFDECDFQKNGTHNMYSYEISHKNGYIEIVNSNYVGGISQAIIGANGNGKILIENTDFNLDLCGRAGNENMLFRINNKDIDFIVKKCNFVSNEDESEPDKILGFIIRAINNCVFEYNNFYGSKAGIYFENNASIVKATIKDCSFTNVGCKIEGGNEYLSPITILNRNSQSEINILDCIFTNNKSVGVDGSIINVGESVTAKIIFGGDIEITNNETTLGALNLQKLDNITFKKGTKLIIKDNDGGNFVIPASSGTLLQGDLHPDSVVYIELPKDENGDILLQAGDLVIGGKSDDYLVTSSILNNFYVVDEGYSLKFSAEDNGLILVDESILSAESTIITNDRVVVFDNQPHSVEDSDVKVMYGSSEYTDYTILYSLDGEEYSAQKPTFTEIGDYEIFYKITDNYDESRVFTGSLMLRIIGKRIYVTQAPSAQLRSRSALSRAIIYGGSVEDEDGNAVAGSWSFSEPSTVPTQSGSTYQVVFTPANAGLYDNSNTAVAMASVDILYDRVYYRNGIFVTDYDDPNNTLTGFSKLTDMVANLVEGGVIVFGETYYVEGTEEIVATKNLVIERYTSFGSGPMIVINQGANTLSFTGTGSEIIFDGRVSTSNVFTGNIFDNYGTLKLGSMVTIRNFVTKSASGSNAGVASTIYNRPGAELILAGCNITANLVKNGSNDFGGVIYNEGLLRIAGGRFSSNYQNTIESNTTRMGSGGFVYNAGEMIMSGGVLANNFAVYGGAIYADSGSITRLTGGTIIDNYATTGGGVVYVAGDAVLLIGDLNIAGNYANNKWNIVEIEDQNSAIIYNQSTQSVMTGEELEALETLNVKATSNTPTNDNDSGLIVGLLVGCMVLGFVCIVFYKKSRTKRF